MGWGEAFVFGWDLHGMGGVNEERGRGGACLRGTTPYRNRCNSVFYARAVIWRKLKDENNAAHHTAVYLNHGVCKQRGVYKKKGVFSPLRFRLYVAVRF